MTTKCTKKNFKKEEKKKEKKKVEIGDALMPHFLTNKDILHKIVQPLPLP